MQEKKKQSQYGVKPPTIDIEQSESLLGVIVQSPQTATSAGTGQTPVMVKVLSEPDYNPYAERGFKRGLDEKPTLSKFLGCFSLDSGILLSCVADVIQAMVWLTLVFVNAGTIEWPFHLIYFFLCIARLAFAVRFYRQDTEHARSQLYRVHVGSAVALSVLYFLQFLVTYISTQVFPAAIFAWAIIATGCSAYLIVLHRQNWQNFEIDQLRAEAYEQSKIDNSGVICAEDLVLSDGVTQAWASKGGETKVYNPDASFISSAGSQGSEYSTGIGPEAMNASMLSVSNLSDSRIARPGTGSIDQISIDYGADELKSSVQYVQNQQIVEADNCCF